MKTYYSDNDITVVLSAYKRIEYLQIQLDAIQKQTVKPKQIFLFQDGVNSKEKIKIPEKILKQFDVVEISKTNKGVWARFDFARKNVKTKYVCIFDDDTIPGPKWLENCITEMNKKEGLYGAIGILFHNNSYTGDGDHIRVGWAAPNKKTTRVDFVGHSWFLKTQWLNYLFEGTEELQAYKICGEDMTLSQKLQQHGISTFVPPHPKNNKDLWGALPEYSTKFGGDKNSLFVNNGWNKMNEAFCLLVNKYDFKLVKDTHKKEYENHLKTIDNFWKNIFSIQRKYNNGKMMKVITFLWVKIWIKDKNIKKPLYKKLYHLTVKPLLNVITVKKFRDSVKIVARENSLKKQVFEIEKDFPENTVLIFQHQFFDKEGKTCFNGGAERYCVDLADILIESGYNPILIQIGDENTGIWKKSVKKLQIIGLPLKNNEYIQAINKFSKYKFIIYSGALDWGQKLHPNILISHGITWDTHYEDVNISKIYNIFKDVDKFISVDTNTISWLRSTFSKTLKNLDSYYIPNYVDTNTYRPQERKKDKKINITFPRRASPERGYWLMSAALPPILDKYPEVNFQFVGFAHGKEIQDDILYLEQKNKGRVSHCMVTPDEMPSIYQNTDISLIPTIYAEGTSLSCLEAQACGNVVISTNIGGLPNLIIDGYNGLLINPNGQDLMKALDRVLADKNLRKKLSENALSIAKAFDKSIWIERWKKIIKPYKKRVLIVSNSFVGGGLEKRLNNIVNKFYDKYDFSLITKTCLSDMKTKPSSYFRNIYSWEEYDIAIKNTDIIDVHPFFSGNILTEWNIPSKIKKIYTLHGKDSLNENLNFLKNYDRIYIVSELLRNRLCNKYPFVKDKVFLSKNRDVIQKYKNKTKISKNVLFSITNTKDKDFTQSIIDIIPSEYTVHIIGFFEKDSFSRINGQIRYHGFVNVDEFFDNNKFDIVFVRGGYAAMNAIARNIACLCAHSNEEGAYFESVTRDNFEQMSDFNFVARKDFDVKNIIKEIKHIEKSPKNYRCKDLLQAYNDIETMPDLYKNL